MQLLRSLFCFKGADNNQRFIIISGLCIAFVILLQVVAPAAVLFNVIINTALIACFVASSIRRSHDAQCTNKYTIAAVVSFAVFSFALLVLPDASRFLTILFPVLPILFLFAFPSKPLKRYVSGYSGPVDLTPMTIVEPVATQSRSSRIEPSLFGEASIETHDEFSAFPDDHINTNSSASDANNTEQTETLSSVFNVKAQQLHTWLLASTKLTIASAVIISVLVVLVIGLSLTPEQPIVDSDIEPEIENSIAQSATAAVVREHYLEMPDDFYLYLDNYHGLVIHWKADMAKDGEIWSLSTATGDETCSEIEFNRGDLIRTTSVVIENSGDYYANFSPLDSEEIVSLLARRGSFKLCGYTFSLKGSQKALNSNPAYIDMAN